VRECAEEVFSRALGYGSNDASAAAASDVNDAPPPVNRHVPKQPHIDHDAPGAHRMTCFRNVP